MRKEVCEYIRIQDRTRGYKNTTYKKGYRPRATRLRERLPTYVIPRKEHIANENVDAKRGIIRIRGGTRKYVRILRYKKGYCEG